MSVNTWYASYDLIREKVGCICKGHWKDQASQCVRAFLQVDLLVIGQKDYMLHHRKFIPFLNNNPHMYDPTLRENKIHKKTMLV